MTCQRTADILATLQRWADAVNAADEALDLVQAAVGLEPESPLAQAVYDLQGLADQWAGNKIGCGEGWLEWHRLENQMGERGHEAGFDDDLHPIHTLDDLAALLSEDLRRAEAEAP